MGCNARKTNNNLRYSHPDVCTVNKNGHNCCVVKTLVLKAASCDMFQPYSHHQAQHKKIHKRSPQSISVMMGLMMAVRHDHVRPSDLQCSGCVWLYILTDHKQINIWVEE
jgi:hypothetical protein